MKIAHLILAHKNPHQVNRMIAAMDHPAFDFYIHVDNKHPIKLFRQLIQRKNVFFVEKRASIYWGGWGTIQATINGFYEIIEKGYDYVNVISGQDFPIKSSREIYDFFCQNRGDEFITCHLPEGDWADAKSRVTDYHLINFRLPGKHRLEKILTSLLPVRKFPLPYQLVGRANWFTLSVPAVKYCLQFLKNNPQVTRFFKLCWGADEFIFSTLLYNSGFKDHIRDNLVYVDWNSDKKGHPKLLGSNDFEKLRESGKLFARKFDMHEDDSILNAIEERLLFSTAGPLQKQI